MSYGHADKIPGRAIHTPAVGNTPPTDPALYRREDVRPVLATRDIGALYRLLSTCDVSQRTIAALTGQSQSEVSEILKGRQAAMTAPTLGRRAASARRWRRRCVGALSSPLRRWRLSAGCCRVWVS